VNEYQYNVKDSLTLPIWSYTTKAYYSYQKIIITILKEAFSIQCKLNFEINMIVLLLVFFLQEEKGKSQGSLSSLSPGT
jgi:hypothetical protein